MPSADHLCTKKALILHGLLWIANALIQHGRWERSTPTSFGFREYHRQPVYDPLSVLFNADELFAEFPGNVSLVVAAGRD
jgi:hypothetical protein